MPKLELRYPELGRRLRELRKEKTDMSQDRFALYIGVDRTQYCNAEQGKCNLTYEQLIKIANGFGVTLSVLFETVNDTVNSPFYEIRKIEPNEKQH